MNLISELYQFLFIASIIFMVYVLGDFTIKLYGTFSLGKESRFVLSRGEKIILWLSIAIFFTYLV